MLELFWVIGATFIVSLMSFAGLLTLVLNKVTLNKMLLILVGLSAGALMGGAFLHLIPEASESGDGKAWILVLVGFVLFFIIERLLHWHHCHKNGKCKVHTFTYLNLIGDGIHNFIDGLIIAASFLVNVPFGIITTIAIIFHEIPQELGDFGVLVYGGFSKLKALTYNFLTALLAVAGAITGYFFSTAMEFFGELLIPFAAGGFIYIAASDLIPELHKEPNLKKAMASFGFFILGITIMWLVKFIFEG